MLTHFELWAVIFRNTSPLNITMSVARSKYDGHARMWRWQSSSQNVPSTRYNI